MQSVFLEFKISLNGKDYRFQCDPNSPIADVKESLLQCLKWVSQIEDVHKANQTNAEPKNETVKEGEKNVQLQQ